MLFTKETDYAIRIVRALKDGTRRPINEICKLEHIPESFAYKVLKKLDKGGIVESFRGVGGGCELRKPPNQITLHDIIVTVDPDFAVMKCIHNFCENNTEESLCHVHQELVKIQDALETMLKAKSMTEILS